MSTSLTDPNPSPPGASDSAPGEPNALRAALAAAWTQQGESVLALSERTPVLLVFLRHFG